MDASYRSAKEIIPKTIDLLKPISITSAIDFGCGVGTWLKAFLDNGGELVKGIDFGSHDDDQLYIDKESFINMDLTEKIDLKETFDTCFSLEVAEHIEEKQADVFVQNLCRHSNIILFSAAVTGQGGTNHVNEQPQSYWVKKFEAVGYEHYDIIRPEVWNNNNIEPWYKQNIMLYIKSDMDITKCAFNSNDIQHPIDIIHPDSFNQLRKEYEYLSNGGMINKLYLSKKYKKIYKMYKSFKARHGNS